MKFAAAAEDNALGESSAAAADTICAVGTVVWAAVEVTEVAGCCMADAETDDV